MKPTAVVLVKKQPHYRRDAIESGLTKCGFQFAEVGYVPKHGDVLCIWNRNFGEDSLASNWEKAGAKVIVFENGYCGEDSDGRQYYAMALSQHNGAGRWPSGDGSRWNALRIELKPWKTNGGHILVCSQRGIGNPAMTPKFDWYAKVACELRKYTKREIRIRKHPVRHTLSNPLSNELKSAWACVVWSSNCATEALISGIQTFRFGPSIITQGATRKDYKDIDRFVACDRIPAFERLAWAQWSVDEISSGLPFELLLRM